MSGRLWEGRSTGERSSVLLELGISIDLDIELYAEDLQGSRAHARMLAKIGILTPSELASILSGLDQIQTEIEAGNFPLKAELEDIHTHVETRLTEIIGPTAGKLHTARSRNDQIAVDTHLFVKRRASEMKEKILELCRVYVKRAEEEIDTILPGYTHMQVAQPIRLSHHMLAHFWGFLRDAERFAAAARTADRMPLGSGALAGVNYPTDREMLQEELKFAGLYENAMDAVSTRDHIQDFLYACASFAVRCSRACEEIILWNSVEFGFVQIRDDLTTGSSIMPQKKNPDTAELVRGKAGRALGNLINLFVNLKGLPFAYNRDLQEDRAPLLDSARNALLIARSMIELAGGMEFQRAKMTGSLSRGFACATDLADALVSEKKIPFREAHHIVGRLVGQCAAAGITLEEANAAMRSSVSEALLDEAFYRSAIDYNRSADRKVSRGGTARARQMEQIALAKRALES